MGRKTFESLGRVLPNRYHIVITKNEDYEIRNSNVKVINDIKELEKYINSVDEYFVIGGENIYELLMPYAKKMYITKIAESFDADTFFPEINKNEWRIAEREKRKKDEKNIYNYEFLTYERK